MYIKNKQLVCSYFDPFFELKSKVKVGNDRNVETGLRKNYDKNLKDAELKEKTFYI